MFCERGEGGAGDGCIFAGPFCVFFRRTIAKRRAGAGLNDLRRMDDENWSKASDGRDQDRDDWDVSALVNRFTEYLYFFSCESFPRAMQ
jgi:hypothetical protein